MLKILIIKLGAKGDVVRTLPLLLGIKEKYPDSEIYWLTKPSSLEIVRTSPHVDKIFTIPHRFTEKFDVLYNFDIEDDATFPAKETEAGKKYGFYSDSGFISSFNLASEYYINTLFDDEIKKNNQKTYQEMMFEVAELPYKKQHHPLYLDEKDKEYADNFVNENKLNTKKLIGIHMGAGPRWPSKAWAEEKVREFIKKAKQKSYEILLFGGPDEIEKHEKLSRDLEQEGVKIYRNNPENTDREFFSLLNLCKVVVCSDSYALHVSLALKKPTICLIFCSAVNEIEGYNLLTKLVAPRHNEFFPEKLDVYDEELVNSISAEEVLKKVEESLPVS